MNVNIYNELFEIFRNTINKGNLNDEMKIKSELQLDSLDLINFIVNVEETYNSEIIDRYDKIRDITIKELLKDIENIIIEGEINDKNK